MMDEATRRALRAAAKISLTVGLGGCIADIPGRELDAGPPPEDVEMVDGVVQQEDGELADGALDLEVPDAGVDLGGDAEVADAAPDAVVCEEPGSEAWTACCEALGWDWEAVPSCAAWGPPVPPEMGVA